jgi:hypothetical protein
VYDELEAAFFQVLREKNLSWFGTLISPTPKDDAAPLLAIDKKPYRDLILANTISVFDFRIYLLARQCALLAKLGNVNEIPRKASAFLAAFGRRLSEEQVSTLGSLRNGLNQCAFSLTFLISLSSRGYTPPPSASWSSAIHGHQNRCSCHK